MVKSLIFIGVSLTFTAAPLSTLQAESHIDKPVAVNTIVKKKHPAPPSSTQQHPEQQHPEMRAYRAEYNLQSSNMPLNAKAVHTLKKLSDGQFQLRTHAQALFIDLTETAVIEWQNCHSQSITYDYSRQIFNKKHAYQQRFFYNNQQPKHANYLHDGKNLTIPLNTSVDDRLLSQLKVRCRVKAGEKKFTLKVLDKDQIKTQSFKVIGNEKLKLPIGEINSLKVERLREPNSKSKRTTRVWLAPHWDYVVVKAIQENDDEIVTLELVALEF